MFTSIKKLIIPTLLLSYLGCIASYAQTFTADTSFVFEPTPKQKRVFYKKNPPPFLAVYQQNDKMLVLLAASHGPQSIPAVHYAFDTYHPQVALVEREPGQPFGDKCTEAEDAYTAALSAKNNLPLVRTDAGLQQQWDYAKTHGFSYEDFQMLWIIRNAYGFSRQEGQQTNALQEINDYKRTIHNPAWGELFTEERLLSYFQQHYHQDFNTTDFVKLYEDLMEVSPKKWVLQTPFYRLVNISPDVRSVTMLQNITAALNEYPVVFSEMGASHFIDIHKALQRMLGKPRYITANQLSPQILWTDCTLEGLQEKTLLP